MIRAAVVVGVAAGVALLSAGCSAAPSDVREGTRPTLPAAGTRARCPSSAAELPSTDDFGRMIGPGRLPDGFRPVRALRCTWTEVYLDDAATRSEVTVRESRSSSVPPGLSASLELPDQELVPLSHAACSAVATAPEYLVLVDADGDAFMPRLPETPCRDPRREVARAIADLAWTEHRTYRFERPVSE